MGREDTRQAIQSAKAALPSWTAKTAKERAKLLRTWHDLIITHHEALARLLTLEQGKPLAEAKGQETVLLVEPNEIDRKLALSTLLRHRYQVLEASSSVEALLLTQRHPGVVHVAVSDLMMPEISGRDLARRLLKHHPMMKPLFISSRVLREIVKSALHRVNRSCSVAVSGLREGQVAQIWVTISP